MWFEILNLTIIVGQRVDGCYLWAAKRGATLWCGGLWSWVCVMHRVSFFFCEDWDKVEKYRQIRKVWVQKKESENVMSNIWTHRPHPLAFAKHPQRSSHKSFFFKKKPNRFFFWEVGLLDPTWIHIGSALY